VKLIDRLIFGFIAIALCALTVKAFMPGPVEAVQEKVYKINIVEIHGLPIFRSDIIKK